MHCVGFVIPMLGVHYVGSRKDESLFLMRLMYLRIVTSPVANIFSSEASKCSDEASKTAFECIECHIAHWWQTAFRNSRMRQSWCPAKLPRENRAMRRGASAESFSICHTQPGRNQMVKTSAKERARTMCTRASTAPFCSIACTRPPPLRT